MKLHKNFIIFSTANIPRMRASPRGAHFSTTDPRAKSYFNSFLPRQMKWIPDAIKCHEWSGVGKMRPFHPHRSLSVGVRRVNYLLLYIDRRGPWQRKLARIFNCYRAVFGEKWTTAVVFWAGCEFSCVLRAGTCPEWGSCGSRGTDIRPSICRRNQVKSCSGGDRVERRHATF